MNGIERREFMKSAAALGISAATGGASAFAGSEAPKLKFGVLSDIHMHPTVSIDKLEGQLRVMDREKVDAVVFPGDLGGSGLIEEIGRAADAWYRVFPDDCRSDGGKIEKLIVTGNHDELLREVYESEADMRRRSFLFNRAQFWRERFREAYEPISIRTVKGYRFVLRNWVPGRQRCRYGEWNGPQADVAAFMDEHAGELAGCQLPFFYIQHEPIGDTVNKTWALAGERWTNTAGPVSGKRIFDRFANCIAITGHSHIPLTDEMSIWQGEFTAVNASCSCGYAFTPPGRDNGFAHDDFRRDPPPEMGAIDKSVIRQGLIVEVYGDHVTVRRLDLMYHEKLAENWDFPVFAGGATVPPEGTPKYDFKSRAAAAALHPPEFPENAEISVKYVKDGRRRRVNDNSGRVDPAPREQIWVEFPCASAANRAFDYSVKVSEIVANVKRTLEEKRVFSPNGFLAPVRDTKPVVCAFSRENIPFERLLEVEATPFDSWGNRGRSIVRQVRLARP